LDGKGVRLARLFSRGNAVVVAADHGEFDGPLPGLIDLPQALEAIDDQADGILLSPGMLPHCSDAFRYRGAPLAIVRLNWNTVYCFGWEYTEAVGASVITPEEAVTLGADMVLVSLTLHTGSEANDAHNVELFVRLAAQAHGLGLPVIGELFPNRTGELSPEQLHEEVYRGCRVVCELGADLIKTFFTHRFDQVTAGVPIPVLGLGAEKTPNELEALNLARSEIAAGAKGVVFGRNVLQSRDPHGFLAALSEVVKRGVEPEAAAREHGFA